MEPVTLTTERLVLRPLGPADADAVFAACQDPEIQRWTSVPSPYLAEHARGFVGEVVPRGWATDTEYGFGAFLAPEGGADGEGPLVACLGLVARGSGTLELGFWSVKEHRGRGHVTEAARALCRWAFTDRGAARVEWRAEVGNKASRAVAERCGFVHEGTLRQAIATRDGHRDAWIASLVPADLST
jgi:RimJ/RimL family protein N-acetyltransferase